MELTFFPQLDAFLRGFPLLQEYDLLERLVVVSIYVVLAKVFDLIIIRSLRKVAKRTRMHFDDFLIDFFHRPFLVTVILLGVLHACSLQPVLPHVAGFIIPNNFATFSVVNCIGRS